ncbi:hypothetical protein C8C83_0678 [Flavobacterium sp. 90]|uniref:hypothetical protein n=1 Tax=unclassified Flavobacterium TaxID=196869 RepID=UPI000EB22C51|nr:MULTISPECIES: hypothetical protein [unclassified Flavobacterium]RKR09078.1 hypothetical protein C8C82_0976 [Flavobacterium sp. 81]TCK52862.1 hypothetical protein C8C83_0678 [Flavobacterium sp. 90]
MELSKKCFNFSANSILESVIALTIISICLYFAVLIFASVYTSKTSAKFYGTQNKVNELFYLLELKNDSVLNESQNENLLIEEEIINDNLKKILIEYKDSTQFKFKKSFYVQDAE